MDTQWKNNDVISSIGAGLLVIALGASSLALADEYESAPGESDFKNYCASCHGVSGRGDGPVSYYLKNPPTDLTALAAVNDGSFPKQRVRNSVEGNEEYDKNFRTHGPSDMPVWGKIIFEDSGERSSIAKARINNIVSYIESLQK